MKGIEASGIIQASKSSVKKRVGGRQVNILEFEERHSLLAAHKKGKYLLYLAIIAGFKALNMLFHNKKR